MLGAKAALVTEVMESVLYLVAAYEIQAEFAMNFEKTRLMSANNLEKSGSSYVLFSFIKDWLVLQSDNQIF